MSPWASGNSLTPSTLNNTIPSWFTGNAFVSVKQYGATGLGVVSDTSSIQSAIDSLISIGGTVYFPRGTYLLSQPIVLDTRHESIALIGEARGRGTYIVTAVLLNATGQAISTATTGQYATSATSVLYGSTIQNMAVAGSGDHLMVLNGMYSAQLNSLYLSGSGSSKDDLQLSNVVDMSISDLRVAGAGRYGVNITGACTSIRVRGGYISYAQTAGLTNIGATQCSDFIVDGTVFESNGRNSVSNASILNAAGVGMQLENLTSGQINGYFEGNVNADLVLGGFVSSGGSITKGVQCHDVVVDGYFYGTSGADPQACRDGVVLVNAKGVDINGYFSTHSRAEFKIQSGASIEVADVRFSRLDFGSVPSGYINDNFNRLDPTIPPNRFSIGATLGSNGSALEPSFAFGSEKSLGLYRSANSHMALSYGTFQASVVSAGALTVDNNAGIVGRLGVGDGVAIAPGIRFNSENSLGFWRSGNSTINVSYGTFDVTAARLSLKTLGTSLNSTNVGVNELAVFVGGASGATLALRSGGTIYFFASSVSTVG